MKLARDRANAELDIEDMNMQMELAGLKISNKF